MRRKVEVIVHPGQERAGALIQALVEAAANGEPHKYREARYSPGACIWCEEPPAAPAHRNGPPLLAPDPVNVG